MKEFILTEQESERTVLVGLVTPQQNEAKVNEYLDELAFLADTAGAVPVKNFVQKLCLNKKVGIDLLGIKKG